MKKSVKFIYISDQYRQAWINYLGINENINPGIYSNEDRGWREYSKEFKEEFVFKLQEERYTIKKFTRPTDWYLIDKMREKEYLFNTSMINYPIIPYEYTENLPSFTDMCMERAIEMRDMGKVIDIFYSGGIDSVAILLALHEICPDDQLHVIMGGGDQPIKEYPKLYSNLIKFLPNVTIDRGDLFGQAQIDTNLFTSGCEADQLYGADGYTQITMYAQRDPNSEFGYYIDTSKPGNLAERENREWNENRRENKVRHLLLNSSFRFLRNLHVDKMDVSNYQPFFLHPNFDRHGTNIHLSGEMYYYTPSPLEHHKERYRYAKIYIRDFIYEKTKDRDYAYGAPKTIMNSSVQREFSLPIPPNFSVFAITEDGIIVNKDNILEFMGPECLTIDE